MKTLRTWLIADVKADGSRTVHWACVEAYTADEALSKHLARIEEQGTTRSSHWKRLTNGETVRFAVARKILTNAHSPGSLNAVNITGIEFFDVNVESQPRVTVKKATL